MGGEGGLKYPYPLTQVPRSLPNVDGSKKKTSKEKLLQKLESRVASVKPASLDVMIIDAMFFLDLLVDPPSPFGNSSVYSWSHLVNNES